MICYIQLSNFIFDKVELLRYLEFPNVNPFGQSVHILQNDGNFLNTTDAINFGKNPDTQKHDSLALSELCCFTLLWLAFCCKSLGQRLWSTRVTD